MNDHLGGGGRFAALEHSFGPSVRNPAALAASIGRAKMGSAKMAGLAQHGTGAAGMPNHPEPSVVQHHVVHHVMHHLFGG